MENQKFCSRCGMAMEASVTFCPRCGECVGAQAPAAPAAPAAPTPIEQYNMNVTAKRGLAAKIDIKKTVLSNIVPVACLGVGLTMFLVGAVMPTVSEYINSYAMHEYVGGDAYNFIIEACLRGGNIAGNLASKAILIAVGLLISCMSALKVKIVKPEQENN